MTVQRGAFIVAEGLDGAGKTSNVRNLENYLLGKEMDYFVTFEPGGTKFCNKLRKLLKEQEQPLDPLTESMLFYAARIEHTEKIIAPYLDRGYTVISDRYYDSSLAYQGANGPDVYAVHKLCEAKMRKPDLVLFYDIPEDVYLARVEERNGIVGLDSFESRGLGYFRKVRANFKAIALTRPEYQIINAARPLDAVFTESIERVEEFLRTFNENHLQSQE